jgi:hypothetical protein
MMKISVLGKMETSKSVPEKNWIWWKWPQSETKADNIIGKIWHGQKSEKE